MRYALLLGCLLVLGGCEALIVASNVYPAISAAAAAR
jgi:hypothetical protein